MSLNDIPFPISRNISSIFVQRNRISIPHKQTYSATFQELKQIKLLFKTNLNCIYSTHLTPSTIYLFGQLKEQYHTYIIPHHNRHTHTHTPAASNLRKGGQKKTSFGSPQSAVKKPQTGLKSAEKWFSSDCMFPSNFPAQS